MATPGERVCATKRCGVVLPVHQGRARPRKYCEGCRPSRNTPNPRVMPMSKPSRSSEQPLSAVEASVVAAYETRLEAAGMLDTPDGAHAMLLARMLEQGAGSMTASGAAALSKELRAAMAVALKDAPSENDYLDELAARRRNKAAGA